jgi:hypothetical protein
MATENEILEAHNKVDDNADIQESLDALTNIVGGSGDLEILVSRDGVTFSSLSLKGNLDTDAADPAVVQLVSDINAAVLAALGADEVTATTVRKAVKDCKDTFDADIAAT